MDGGRDAFLCPRCGWDLIRLGYLSWLILRQRQSWHAWCGGWRVEDGQTIGRVLSLVLAKPYPKRLRLFHAILGIQSAQSWPWSFLQMIKSLTTSTYLSRGGRGCYSNILPALAFVLRYFSGDLHMVCQTIRQGWGRACVSPLSKLHSKQQRTNCRSSRCIAPRHSILGKQLYRCYPHYGG